MKNLLSLFCFSFMTLLSVGSVSAQHGWTSSSTAKNDTEALRSSAMATESDCAALRYQALNLGLYTVDISNYQWFNTNLNTPAGLAYLATKQAQQATRIAACNTLYDALYAISFSPLLTEINDLQVEAQTAIDDAEAEYYRYLAPLHGHTNQTAIAAYEIAYAKWLAYKAAIDACKASSQNYINAINAHQASENSMMDWLNWYNGVAPFDGSVG